MRLDDGADADDEDEDDEDADDEDEGVDDDDDDYGDDDNDDNDGSIFVENRINSMFVLLCSFFGAEKVAFRMDCLNQQAGYAHGRCNAQGRGEWYQLTQQAEKRCCRRAL